MRTTTAVIMAAALMASFQSMAADGGSLVSSEWLAERLADDGLVILHVGAAKDYQQGHIPGARLVEVPDISISSDPGLRVELPPLDKLREEFGRLGIGDESRIVLYAGTPSYQSMTRVFFTLDYIGVAERTSILDGGLTVWSSEQRPISTDTPSVSPSSLTVQPNPALVVDAGWIREHTGADGMAIVDARTPEFYTGASAGMMPRAGRLPGAKNIPFTTIVDEKGRFRSREELEGLFRAAGISPGATVVTYCHIGMQATALYWVARSLGHPVRLYDGSFQDWSHRTDLPVETSATSR